MMSEPILSRSGYDELRRRFAVWSLAIFGTLSGSGHVRLDAAAWTTDDPPAGSPANPTDKPAEKPTEKPTDDKPATDKPANDKPAETEKARKDAADQQAETAKLMALIRSKNYDEAKVLVDTALALTPSDPNLYRASLLASSMASAGAVDSIERLRAVIDASIPRLQESQSASLRFAFLGSTNALASLYSRTKNYDATIRLFSELRDVSSSFKDKSITGTLTPGLARALSQGGRADEGERMLRAEIEAAQELAQKPEATTEDRINFSRSLSSYGALFGTQNAEVYANFRNTAELLFKKAIESQDANLNDITNYLSAAVSRALEIGKSDPELAMQRLDALESESDELAAKRTEEDQKRIKSLSVMIKNGKRSLEAKLLHKSLIGKPAPEFEIAEVVEMPTVSWAELKGKVVLIDFWAVWCGPCIATFPHLRQWQKEYGDKGLVVVGVTRQYGYKWDADESRAKADREATLEDELAMLGEFRKHHELGHGFVLTPQGSEYSKKFGVTGIPQAVLVDQNGVVQMIKVGSDEKNAVEIENKIKSLLGIAQEETSKAAGS